jgi:hypothetical protein
VDVKGTFAVSVQAEPVVMVVTNVSLTLLTVVEYLVPTDLVSISRQSKMDQSSLRERQSLDLCLRLHDTFDLGIVDGGRDYGHIGVGLRYKLGLEGSDRLVLG